MEPNVLNPITYLIPEDMGPAYKKLKAEDGGAATEPAVSEQVAVVSATEQPSVISASNQAAVISASEQPAVISTSEQSVGDYTSEQAMVISASLAMFLGSDEKEMLQSEALKRVFDYIKENQLEVSIGRVHNHLTFQPVRYFSLFSSVACFTGCRVDHEYLLLNVAFF